MKKKIFTTLLLLFAFTKFQAAWAQAQETQQLILNTEKLAQFKQILSDMKKGYQVLEKGYNTIKDISEGNFNLHKAFLDGLLAVSPTVRNYHKVGEIVNYQVVLVREYRAAYNRFRSDHLFAPQEISYIGGIYDHLFKESLRNLDELLLIVTAGQARMSDDERLQAIDRIHADMQDKLEFLRNFNNNTSVLSLQRQKEFNDSRAVQKLNGLQH